MDNIVLKEGIVFVEEDIRYLYLDAQWTNYTKDMPRLMKALKKSLMVVTAWEDDKLVGLIRVVGDGLTIIYIQDILVKRAYKRKGIGTALLRYVMDKYRDVNQKVLLTDNTPETRGFYEHNGFIACDKGNLVAFVKFK